ncbi:interleukin-12 subunit alpha [Ochotona princeps]|uniref:interleukin-12 subunit alpha n=1 Tax=Ochotona princeps TaxID=9978 RepID=UPI002714D7AE|nr:interleukin-12 subunit alpha [Ochotona princeps]
MSAVEQLLGGGYHQHFVGHGDASASHKMGLTTATETGNLAVPDYSGQRELARKTERESKRPQSRESPGVPPRNYKNVAPGSAQQHPPSPAVPTGPRPAARSVSAPHPGSACDPYAVSLLLLVSALVLLSHVSLARNLPVASPGLGMFQCLNHSQNLLRAVSSTLHKARQTLEFYSCTPEEIDHEDITKDKTSTVKACLPLELVKNESCLASREASLITNGSCLSSGRTSSMVSLCLSSIYEDLRMYQMEFMAMNAKLLVDPNRQISLDQNMLGAMDELMQALNSNSEAAPPTPSLEELDFYKTKIKLCILLHAFRIRAVTIDRMMSYLNSS